MKNLDSLFRANRARRLFRYAFGVAVSLSIIGWSDQAAAQFDDFNDGNDAGWTHLGGYVGSTGQMWDASTGVYRLTAPNNSPVVAGLGFVGSHVGSAYTDVTVSADLVSFTGAPGPVAYGIAARLNGNNALAALTGYAYAYEPNAAGGLGEMVLYKIGPSIAANDIGSQAVTLDPSKDYKFVLDISGTTLHGQVFEIGGGQVADIMRTDASYASGFSGLIAYSSTPLPPTDYSIDNFQAVPEPGSSLLIGLGVVGLLVGRRVWGKRS